MIANRDLPCIPPAPVYTRLQESPLSRREQLLIAAAMSGERALEVMRRVRFTDEPAAPLLWYPIAAEYARFAWGTALDALGWREA